MGSLLEQARLAAGIDRLGVGTNYAVTFQEELDKQRAQTVEPQSVEEPFERIFFLDDQATEQGNVVFIIPFPDVYEQTSFQVRFKFQLLEGLSWAPRAVQALEIVNQATDQRLDLREGAQATIFLLRDIDRYGCNPYSGQLCVGIPDNFAAFYSIGHEKMHLKDKALNDALLARATIKKEAYELAKGKKGIPFGGSKEKVIRAQLHMRGSTFLDHAQATLDEVLLEPLTPEQGTVLLNSEVWASEGGIDFLKDVLDFLGFDRFQQGPVVTGATQFAIDKLSSYVNFAEGEVGKNFYDWIEE